MHSVLEAWREQILAHERDMQAVRGNGHEHGHGRPGGFGYANRPLDPYRTDDAALNGLFAVLGSGTEVLDVGGGAGRFALPLATRAKRVTVVERSEDSLELLKCSAAEAGITNISIIHESWEDAQPPMADMVLCSLVIHHVPEVVPFVSKLQDHAKNRVVMLEMNETPGSIDQPFYEKIYGSALTPLPGLARVMEVLWALDIYPDVKMTRPEPVVVASDRDAAIDHMRQRMGIEEATAEDERLRAAADELLEETTDGITVRGVAPRRQAIITWQPIRQD